MNATQLVEAARSLADVVAGGAEEADRERRLPARVAEAMAGAGLYRTSVAAVFGGFEADPVTTTRVIEAVSEADGSAGWNLMIALETGGIASGHMAEQAGRDVWGDPGAIMSGALNALGRATPVEGGWRLTGQWPYASGCHNAGWFWAGAMLNDGGTDRPIQLMVPRSDYTIIDTWDVAGMRGSGSHDVRVEDAFIPAHRATDVYRSRPRQTTPLFRYPLVSRLCYTKAGVATGIARAAIEAFAELAGAKKPFLSQQLLRERAHAQLAIAEAEAMLSSGRAFLFEVLDEMWDEVVAGRTPSDRLRIRQRLAASWAVDASVKAVELLYRSSGATANFHSSPLERMFRDVHVVRAHTTVAPAVFETAGRALLGMEVAPGSF